MACTNEMLANATAAGTEYCVESAGVPQKAVTIDAAYVAASTPIIRDRLKRAGVRLAHLLDEALGP